MNKDDYYWQEFKVLTKLHLKSFRNHVSFVLCLTVLNTFNNISSRTHL